jgi:uncharacterized membrane protein YkvA (DUF1232 family)
MEQNFGWLQKTCRRMVIQLLDSCDSEKYDQAKEGIAYSALNYYGSKFTLIPDVIPGLGYLDDFLILVTTMWVCGERELPEPSTHEEEQLPYRLGQFLEKVEAEEAEKIRLAKMEKLQKKNREKLEEILLEQPQRIKERFAARLGFSLSGTSLDTKKEVSKKEVSKKEVSKKEVSKKDTSKILSKERSDSVQKKNQDRNVERSSKLKDLSSNADINNPFAKNNDKSDTVSNSASHM